MDHLLEESEKRFGGQLLCAFSGLFGKREIEDLLRMWNSQSKGCNTCFCVTC